ncbi:Protein translocase subunit SecA 2 [Bienertia sinuspersici]
MGEGGAATTQGGRGEKQTCTGGRRGAGTAHVVLKDSKYQININYYMRLEGWVGSRAAQGHNEIILSFHLDNQGGLIGFDESLDVV